MKKNISITITYVAAIVIVVLALWSCAEDEADKISVSYPEQPTISAVEPASGFEGTQVQISGTSFNEDAARNEVYFNGVETEIIEATETKLTVLVPEGAGSGHVTVRVAGKVATGPVFTVGVHTPVISTLTPESGIEGIEVTISGEYFGKVSSENIVKFNGLEATIVSASENSIVVTVPVGATTGKVSVTVNEQTGDGPIFTVEDPLAITSISPTSGAEGVEVIITGVSFSTTLADNVVKFNGLAAVVSASTMTAITTTVPAGATTGSISVEVNGQSASSQEFTVEGGKVPYFTTTPSSGVSVGLSKVFFADATTVYVVGEAGAVLKSTDGGATWSDQTSSTGVTVDLEGVHFVSASTGWVVGDDGVVIKTTDGGANWTNLTTGTGTTETLRCVHFINATTGFVGGSAGVIIATTDGGANWSAQTSGLEVPDERIYDIYFKDASNGIIVGGGGYISTTSDGGTTWVPQVDVNGAGESWKRVRFADTNSGWVVGSGGSIYKTTNGGTSWSAQSSPSDADYNDLVLVDSQTLIAVGDHNSGGDVTAMVAKTYDGGATWIREAHGLTDDADDIELNGGGTFDGASVVAVGDDGVILN